MKAFGLAALGAATLLMTGCQRPLVPPPEQVVYVQPPAPVQVAQAPVTLPPQQLQPPQQPPVSLPPQQLQQPMPPPVSLPPQQLQSPVQPQAIYVQPAPPPDVAEILPPPPDRRPIWVWQRGYWRWDGYQYVWAPGHWEGRPRGRAAWVPPHWERGPRGHVFIEGYWR